MAAAGFNTLNGKEKQTAAAILADSTRTDTIGDVLLRCCRSAQAPLLFSGGIVGEKVQMRNTDRESRAKRQRLSWERFGCSSITQ
jgi:hypothetical protein